MNDEAIDLRSAVSSDELLLFQWRNDETTRLASVCSDPIKLSDHRSWFRKSLTNPHRLIQIGHYSGENIGMVRFDHFPEEARAEVSIIMAPQFRGKKLAACLLAAALKNNPFVGIRLTATIRPTNIASIKTFEKNGFQFWRENCFLKGEYL